MANEQIKINELAEGNISLSDFIAKAGASGIATKITLQKLADVITSASDSQFKGALTIAQAAATPADGWYFPSEAGDYVLANGETKTVVLTNKLNILIIGATHTDIEAIVIPVSITVDTVPTDGSSNAVSSNGVFDALANVTITKDATVIEGSTNPVEGGAVFSTNDALQGSIDKITSSNLFDYTRDIVLNSLLTYNDSDPNNITYTINSSFTNYSDSTFIHIEPNTLFANNLRELGNRTILLDKDLVITRVLGEADFNFETTSEEVFIHFNWATNDTYADRLTLLQNTFIVKSKDLNKYLKHTEVNTDDLSKLNLSGVLKAGGTGQVVQPSKYMSSFLHTLNANLVSTQENLIYGNTVREEITGDYASKYISFSSLIYLPNNDISDIGFSYYAYTASGVQYNLQEFATIEKVTDNIYYLMIGGFCTSITTTKVRFEVKVAVNSETGAGATLKLPEIAYLRYSVTDAKSFIPFSFDNPFVQENTAYLKPNFYGKPFTKITLLGTSIEEEKYFDEVAEKYGLIENVDYLNFGYGSGVCVWDTVNGTDNNIKSSWSASLAEKQAEATTRGITLTDKDENVCYDQSTLPNADSELIIIGTYGINSRGSYLANRFSTDSEFDRTSIYGAYNYVLNKLFEASPEARVIILGQPHFELTNLDTVNDLQKLVAEKWNIYFADWGKRLGVNEDTADYYLRDGLHPDQELRDVMAKMLIKDLKNRN